MTYERKLAVRREIDRAFARGPLPAPICVPDCDDFEPAIGCRRDCAAAARRLSSDPDRHPVEPHVAPLVFELKRLGVFYPCWSCEGHNDSAGVLWKIPRVWFNTDSSVYVRALSQALGDGQFRQRLTAAWHVVVTNLDAAYAETVYSLEPGLDPRGSALADLRADLLVLATGFEDAFWQACAKILR